MFTRIKRLIWKTGAITMLLSLPGITIALAASGRLDGTFGAGGLQTTDFGSSWSDTLRGIALQPDGRILAVGDRFDPTDHDPWDFALARYGADGILDPTFSGDGMLITDVGAVDQAADVAVQPDGKIVVSGQTCLASPGIGCDLALIRYNSDGSGLDSGFNGGSPVLVDFGGGDNGTFGGLIIKADGKIVVGGYMRNGNQYDFAVYRFKPDGTPDLTFSGDGKTRIGFGAGRQDTAYDLRIRNGKIVIVGKTCDSAGGGCNFAVARLTSSGRLDATFSGDGKQTTDIGGGDTAYSVAFQSDGRIVVAGQKAAGSTSVMALVRYTPGGALDPTFSGDGKLTINVGGRAGARHVLLQGTKIVVAGQGYNGVDSDFGVARLRAGGDLDTSFGKNGKALIDFGHEDMAIGMLRQPLDGNYVLGGRTDDGTQLDFALARILH